MSKSRLEILLEFVAADPKDSFARFGVAMEYARLEENDKALDNFRKLWELNPDYTAAYFQAGKLLVKIGNTDMARQVLGDGIQAATRNDDLHSKSEMEAVLAEL